MSLKTIIHYFIVLQLLCSHVHSMEEVETRSKNQHPYYHRTLIQNEDDHNQFEKIAWSPCGNYIASYRYIDNKCEIFIWNIHKKSYDSAISQKPHITLFNKKIVGLFWSPHNKHLIVVCKHAVYKYRIFDKDRGKIKQTLLKNTNLKIYTACFNPSTAHLALVIFDKSQEKDHYRLCIINTLHLKRETFKINDDSSNILGHPRNMTWRYDKNELFVLFASGHKWYYIYDLDMQSLPPTCKFLKPFQPKLQKHPWQQTSQIQVLQNRGTRTFIHSGIVGSNDEYSALVKYNFASPEEHTIIAQKERKYGINPYLFNTSNDGKLLVYCSYLSNTSKQSPNTAFTTINIYDLCKEIDIYNITFSGCPKIYHVTMSPCNGWIAASTSHGIIVTPITLPSVWELQYREIGISEREQARIKRFRKKPKK